MNVGFYSAASGMQAFQQKLDVTANNMANINTTGYKQMNASFRDLIYTNMNTKEDGHEVGHGSKVDSVDYVFTQGVLQRTGKNLDFAIAGQGFFAVDNGGTEPVYTRDGGFRLSLEGQGTYLTDLNGNYVLDNQGQRIAVNYYPGTNTVNYSNLTERIGLFTFDNPDGLTPIGGNLLAAGENTGEAQAVQNHGNNRIYQGVLEASAADTATEMVNMIKAQRAFQLNGRMITTSDQLEEMINNLR